MKVLFKAQSKAQPGAPCEAHPVTPHRCLWTPFLALSLVAALAACAPAPEVDEAQAAPTGTAPTSVVPLGTGAGTATTEPVATTEAAAVTAAETPAEATKATGPEKASEAAVATQAGPGKATPGEPAPATPATDRSTAPPGPTPSSSTPPATPLSPECQKILDEIRTLAKDVPMVFMDLKRPADEIDKDMSRITDLCRQFLKDCATSTAPAADICDAKAILSRMLIGRDDRYKDELVSKERLPPDQVEVKMKARHDEVLAIAKSLDADCPKSLPAWATAQLMAMELLLKLGRNDETRELGARVLKESPPYNLRTGTISAMSRSFLSRGEYEGAVKFLREIVKKHSDDVDCVVYNIRLFEALNGIGDLEGMEELMHLERAEYPERIKTSPEGLLKRQYEQWYNCQSLFWLGFLRMAQGDMDGAKQFFEQNIAEIDTLEARMAAEGQKIDNVCGIFRDFRSWHLLEFIKTMYGKKVTVDLDEVLWATAVRTSFRESLGKVVAVVMRRPGDIRSSSFLQEIDRLVKERGKDGLAGVWLSFLTGRPNPAEDEAMLQKMDEDLAELQVALPAGYDSDRQGQKIFHALYGTLGTASFALLNRKGELIWWLADPRDMDRKLTARVIARVLGEK